MGRRFIFLIWTFFLLYLPPVMGVATIKLIGIFSWIYILSNYNRYITKFKTGKLLIVFLLGISICLYIYAIELLTIGSINQAVAVPAYLVLFAFPSAIAYVIKIDKMQIDEIDIIKAIIWAATIQGAIAIASLFSYSIQSIFVERFYCIMDRQVVDYWRVMRLYGWANGMTYAMPILSAAIGVMALGYAVKFDKRYMLSVPVIWSAGILNARTSMVVIGIGIICLILSYRSINIRKMCLLFVAMLGFIVIVYFVGEYINNKKLFSWVMDGVTEIFSFLQGKSIGYFTYFSVSREGMKLPSDILLGMGYVGARSDIGYIRDLWTGGMIYCGFIISIILYWGSLIYKEIRRKDKKLAIACRLFFLLVFLTVNVKGQIFSANEFIMLFFVLIVYTIYYNKNIT